MKQRKIPMRKCVVTQEMKPKKELIRIVRSKEGEISIDPTGKKSGRGAYLTKSEDVILLAKSKNILASQFNASVDDDIYEALMNYVKQENQSK